MRMVAVGGAVEAASGAAAGVAFDFTAWLVAAVFERSRLTRAVRLRPRCWCCARARTKRVAVAADAPGMVDWLLVTVKESVCVCVCVYEVQRCGRLGLGLAAFREEVSL